MTALPPPSIPDKPELFCHYCTQFTPRHRIVEAKWIRAGKQAVYRCLTCMDQMQARLSAT